MIEASLDLADLTATPEWRDGSICFSNSFITPVSHQGLVVRFISHSESWLLVVRERECLEQLACDISYGVTVGEIWNELESLQNFDLDYLAVEWTSTQEGGTLRILSGPMGILPAYAYLEKSALTITWDYRRILTQCPSKRIDLKAVCHRLVGDFRYGPRMMLSSVVALTERSSLYMTANGVDFQFPGPCIVDGGYEKSPLSIDAAAELFIETLKTRIARRPLRATDICTELSGGIDSAMVSAVLKCIYGADPLALSIHTDSVFFRTDTPRRTSLIGFFGFHSRELEAFDFSSNFIEDTAPLWGEYFHCIFGKLWRMAQNDERSFRFSGIGGDEICSTSQQMLFSDLWSSHHKILTKNAIELLKDVFVGDYSPGYCTKTGLLAAANQSPFLIEKGILSIAPLNDPAIVHFFSLLPDSMKTDKCIIRRSLEILGAYDPFKALPDPESFNLFAIHAIQLKQNTIRNIFSSSRLADLEIVNGAALMSMFDDFLANPRNDLKFLILSILDVELILRALL
ncbi:hypothetical protein [Burkholderia plantarii]|uniref:hypothetical protein n=1 Tax=Burkholderia plantarii TaxID=41899 RepID=UPI0018DD2B9E|nr:hypothetical protein [Burkholderia plantarii]MBI0330413.1 hypothetical protein [Burkholderia plantarii]